jgi:hypothetical protein
VHFGDEKLVFRRISWNYSAIEASMRQWKAVETGRRSEPTFSFFSAAINSLTVGVSPATMMLVRELTQAISRLSRLISDNTTYSLSDLNFTMSML